LQVRSDRSTIRTGYRFIVAEAGHETVGWTQCARNLVAQFVENLQPGDTNCASSPETVWPAVGRFPYPVEDARPAEIDSSGNNQIGVGERKTASVAVATAIDALQRSLIGGSGAPALASGAGPSKRFLVPQL
jgi:hypothetical protein